MSYDDLIVLIPSHSLEDFPTELSEEQAESLLNAFAIAWHPALLASARLIPSWHRSDEPPDVIKNRLIIVPTACDDWLPHGWVEQATEEGAFVVSGIVERQEMLEAALATLDSAEPVDSELAADFLALGSSYLQLELLTRQMHHYSQFDEVHLQREVLSAADAVLASDLEAARTHLAACFEVLTESRERFYPVECFLIDVCLLIPRLADEHLTRLLENDTPVNFLFNAEDLQSIAADKPDIVQKLREAWQAETIDIVGGEYRDNSLPLLPLESVFENFARGQEVFQRLLGRTPTSWGRRRFGLTTQLPQILTKLGYQLAMHVVLDDGIYPDEEHSKIRWEGCDGTIMDATTRIPLATESASSFLRFASRMSESMEEDQVAAVLFARWPEVTTPWLEDFERAQRYSACLGKFVTFNDFCEHTDDPGRLSNYDAKQYLSPFLLQGVARQEADPISRYSEHFLRRRRFETGRWYRAMASVLVRQEKGVDDEEAFRLDQQIEDFGPDVRERQDEESIEPPHNEETPSTDNSNNETPESLEALNADVEAFVEKSAGRLGELIMNQAGNEAGYLLLNSLSFARRVSVDLPGLSSAPKLEGPVKAVQFDGNRKLVTVEVPGSGFVWVSGSPTENSNRGRSTVSMAEENLLRNEFFEVHVNESTGGIAKIKEYGRKPNRLSQQLAFRFPRERTVMVGEGEDAKEVSTYYSEMRATNPQVISSGSAMGEIKTSGEIFDQQDNSPLARFQQTIRVWRARPIVELEIELEVEQMPEGDPWSNFFASRFAWNDSTASLTRSVLEGAHSSQGERFESPHFMEIASESERTTILSLGLPFHRKTGPRMVDSLLVAEGETMRRFRFVIAVDANYPMQAALDAITPTAIIPTKTGPPRGGSSGWFFHLNTKAVQLTRVMKLMSEPPESQEPWEEENEAAIPTGPGFAVRLLETEGRHRRVKLTCFRKPDFARQRDFQGRTLNDLPLENDIVHVEMMPYEIADVEIRFNE